jgi:hypothetical protein
MKTDKQKLNRAIDLLGEIASQDFVTDALWDCVELRRWKRKVLRLMTVCGYVYDPPISLEQVFHPRYETPGDTADTTSHEPVQ